MATETACMVVICLLLIVFSVTVVFPLLQIIVVTIASLIFALLVVVREGLYNMIQHVLGGRK